MKKLVSLGLAILSLSSAFASGHHDGRRDGGHAAYSLKVLNPEVLREGRDLPLRLALVHHETGEWATPEDLAVSHEKLFHFFAFDAGLTNYLHLHPEHVANGEWTVDARFARAGTYRLWADILPMGADESMTALHTVKVAGDSKPNETPKGLEPKVSATDGNSMIELGGANHLKAGSMAMLTIRFFRTDGTQPVVTPYLGALAHFVITDLSGTKLLHSHPMEMGGSLMVHTTFPERGDYRIFAQYVDGGTLRTMEMAVRVKK